MNPLRGADLLPRGIYFFLNGAGRSSQENPSSAPAQTSTRGELTRHFTRAAPSTGGEIQRSRAHSEPSSDLRPQRLHCPRTTVSGQSFFSFSEEQERARTSECDRLGTPRQPRHIQRQNGRFVKTDTVTQYLFRHALKGATKQGAGLHLQAQKTHVQSTYISTLASIELVRQ